ncbi:hypothetical protein EUX98_g7432 [Antrodiella citrinella]|uniref:DUF6697 domain-containing protein n=1 Tax=Antrodiella citrinella TaxID=2447956 RepID=A0A4S4MN84_9APHY|nr:hypothetical protein EUX98_g7432 [Antrodiella citrinella]
MAAKYHCNLIQVYTKDFAFPNPSMNPEIPTVPGQPGLMCDAVTVDVDWTQTRKILVRHAVNQWQYLGNYQAARVRSLAVEEFSSLAQIVKDTWVEYIIDAKWDSYKALHAKIGLHERYGREASEDELNDALAANEQFLLSPEVVLAAFESGQHRRLAQDFPGWVPPPKLSAEGRKAKAEAKAKAKAKAKSKAKAKAKTKPPAPAPAVVKNEVNEDDEYAPLHPPAHRGTRNVAPNDPSEATVGVRRSCRTVKTLRRYIEIGEDGEEYRDEPMEVE